MANSNVHEIRKGSHSFGGGNSGGGDMEVRVARLEANVEHIQSDITDIKLDVREMKKDITDLKVGLQVTTNKLLLAIFSSAGLVVAAIKYL